MIKAATSMTKDVYESMEIRECEDRATWPTIVGSQLERNAQIAASVSCGPLEWFSLFHGKVRMQFV
jgi:hypothetical protein